MDLGPTVGDLLQSAIGVAISPVPVIAVILVLGTPQARRTGTAFAVGWVLGLVAVSTIVLLVADGASDADGAVDAGVDWSKLVFGVLFLVLAGKQWRDRPRPGAEAKMPEWMAAIDSFGAAKALGFGAVLSGVNPKNLALTAAAAGTVAQAGLTGGDEALAVGVFVAVASLTVVGPVAVYWVGPERAAGPLGVIKQFLSDHNAAIMMTVLVVLGLKLVGQGIAGI